MSDVFISYSRKDSDFAKKLTNSLVETGRDIWVDWEDIARGADWLHEIFSGVESADTFVFIVSEHSLTSEICNREIEHARKHNKRIIPLILRDMTQDKQLDQYVKAQWFEADWMDLARDNWQALGHSNWLFFNTEDKFDAEFDALVTALETDLEYVKLHTRLLVRAREWETAGRSPSFLLTGDEIKDAETWLKSGINEDKDPTPTPLHEGYITASRQREDDEKEQLSTLIEARQASETQAQRSRRLALVAGVATVIAIIVGVIAGMQAVNAQSQAESAKTQVAQAVVAQDEALALADIASTSEANARNQANIAVTSEFEAIIAQQTAEEQANNAETQVFIAGETLTPIPVTLEAVATLQDDSYRFQMAGQAQFNEGNENDALAFAFEAISNEQPPIDVQPIFYDIAGNSHNRMRLSGPPVRSLAFSPDGFTLASAQSSTIMILDVSSGDERATLIGHESIVDNVAFSPSGHTLASASWDETIKLWDVVTGQEVMTLTGHSNKVRSVAFSPDGNILVSSSDDRTIKLWDIHTGDELATFIGHNSDVFSVKFSPDGKILASANQYNAIKLWDVATGQVLNTLAGHSFVFSPDGQTLASGSNDTSVKLWNVANGQELLSLNGHSSGIMSVAFSPDGNTLASASCGELTSRDCSGEGEIKLWDAHTGDELAMFVVDAYGSMILAFSPDSQTLASASNRSGSIKLWDVPSGNKLNTIIRYPDGYPRITFSPDGNTLVLSAGRITLWQVADGNQFPTFFRHENVVNSVAFSPDGQTLASASFQEVKLWDVASGNELESLRHEWVVNSVAFSPDGHTLASASCTRSDHSCSQGEIKLWNVADRQDFLTLADDDDSEVINVVFSPNGKTLASVSRNRIVKLWDVASGNPLHTLIVHDGAIVSYESNSMAFSPDGKILATTHFEDIKLWDVASGDEAITLSGHDSRVWSVAFSPDGKTLATAAGSEIRLWDMATGDMLATLTDQEIGSMTFSPDGTTIVYGSWPDIKLWNIGSLPLMRQWVQENRYIREFTCKERERFNMPVQCDAEGKFPTRTPYPTPSPIPLPSWTPFWTPLPTTTITPVPTLDFTPFHLNPTALSQVEATGTAWILALTPTATPTTSPPRHSDIGENSGEIQVSWYERWTYEGQAGEVLTIRVNADKPGSGVSTGTWIEQGLFDTLLIVYSPDGTELAKNDDIDGANNTDSQITELELPVDGTYIIEIKSAFGGKTGGAYTLVIESADVTATPTATMTLTATADAGD